MDTLWTPGYGTKFKTCGCGFKSRRARHIFSFLDNRNTLLTEVTYFQVVTFILSNSTLFIRYDTWKNLHGFLARAQSYCQMLWMGILA